MRFSELMQFHNVSLTNPAWAFELACACRVRTQTIYNWYKNGIPRSRQLEIQEDSHGKLHADKPKRNGK